MRSPSVSDAPLLNTVMPGLVPGIHVLARGPKARGWPERRREAKLPRALRPAVTTFADRHSNLSNDANATLSPGTRIPVLPNVQVFPLESINQLRKALRTLR